MDITSKSENELLSELVDLTKKFNLDIEHFTLDYDELVEIFHEYMFELVSYSPLNLYNNPLSRFIKRHLGNEIPGCFLDEFKFYEEDEEFKNDLASIRSYYDDIINEGYGISDSEFLELYHLSLIEDDNSYKYIKYLLSQLIEDNNSTSYSIYRDIISRFIQGVIDGNELGVQFSIGNIDDEEAIADSIKRHGSYYVTFDRKHLNSGKVMFNLEDIFHELWHTVQEDSNYNDEEVIRLFKMDDFIRKVFGDSYYDENYNIISYEVDANMHAVMMQGELLKEISPATYELNKDWLMRRVTRYNELLYSKKRYFMGAENDIDVLFDWALIESGKSYEDVFSSEPKEKKYIKEIKF